MSNKKLLKVIKFQGKSSAVRGIKTKKTTGGGGGERGEGNFSLPPGLDRVKRISKSFFGNVKK